MTPETPRDDSAAVHDSAMDDDSSKGEDSAIVERLKRSRLTVNNPDRWGETRRLFVGAVQPVLRSLGVSTEIVEVYSPERRSECYKAFAKRYILFDHGQLECLRMLDWLLAERADAPTVATSFQRMLAEASRSAQLPDLYLFFIQRAKEAAALNVAPSYTADTQTSRTCHAFLILFHEGAHALTADQELRAAAETYATLSITGLLTELIASLLSSFEEAMGEDRSNGQLREDLLAWSAVRNDLKVSDDAISSALYRVARDPRFREEIACDRIALCLHQLILEGERSSMTAHEYELLAREVLLSTYRCLLHLRLLKYLDDIFANLPSYLTTDKISPLDLHAMVEAGFRGNLIARLVLSAASEVGGDDFVEVVHADLKSAQADHATILFAVVNQLLEMTVLNDDFRRELPDLLAEDGVSHAALCEDAMDAFDRADAIWRTLAEERP